MASTLELKHRQTARGDFTTTTGDCRLVKLEPFGTLVYATLMTALGQVSAFAPADVFGGSIAQFAVDHQRDVLRFRIETIRRERVGPELPLSVLPECDKFYALMSLSCDAPE